MIDVGIVPAPDAAKSALRADWLDAARGLLATWVLLTHIAIWSAYIGYPIPVLDTVNAWLLRVFTPVYETHPAVLAFIVLSGYCIHRSGLREGEVRNFAIRRFFRIYPVFILSLVVGYSVFLIGTALEPERTQAMLVTSHVSPTCLVLRATALLSFSSQAANFCGHLGNAPLSTVMVEIALYVAYPFIILGTADKKHKVLIVSIPYIVGMILAMAVPEMAWWWHNSSLVNFLIFWWIGAYFAENRFKKLNYYWLSIFIAIWAVLTILLFVDPALMIAELRKLTTAIFFAYLFSWLDRPAASSWLARFGRTGYSLYAFHMPIIVLLFALGQPWWVCFFSSVAAGFIGYRFIEVPGISFGQALIKSADKKPVT